jgi:DNA polymerase-1
MEAGLMPLPALLTRVGAPVLLTDRTSWLAHADLGLCTHIDQAFAYVEDAVSAGAPIALDTESTGLNLADPAQHLCGLSVAVDGQSGLYLPTAHYVNTGANLPQASVLRFLRHMEPCTLRLYFARHDLQELAKAFGGWRPPRWQDAMLHVALAFPDAQKIGLKSTAVMLLGRSAPQYVDALGPALTLAHRDPADVAVYAAADACNTYAIADVPAVAGVGRAVSQLEHAITPLLMRHLPGGITMDVAALTAAEHALTMELARLDGLIEQAVGYTFNPRSTEQLAAALAKVGVTLAAKTPTGRAAVGKGVLNALAPTVPLAAYSLARRTAQTWLSNYVAKFHAYWADSDIAFPPGPNKIRVSFTQIGASTGRMSGGEGRRGKRAHAAGVVPANPQAFPDPKRHPEQPDLRASVQADPGHVLVAMDFKQIEVRLAANLSREPVWIEAFQHGEDIHLVNARKAYDLPDLPALVPNPKNPSEMMEQPLRNPGKTLTFAVLYGAGPQRLAATGGITLARAEWLMESFFEKLPTLCNFIVGTQQAARVTKQTTTWLGRQRDLRMYYDSPNPKDRSKGDREAINHPIQGGAADLYKLALLKMDNWLVGQQMGTGDCRFLLFAHDELVLTLHADLVDLVLPHLVQQMESVTHPTARWPIPFLADVEIGPNWSPYHLRPWQGARLTHALTPAASAPTARFALLMER